MTESNAIIVHQHDGYIVAQINNPAARNALSDEVLASLADVVTAADVDPNVRAIVIAGADKVFAAGADLKALSSRRMIDAYDGSRARHWERIRNLRTPSIAAVSGFCFGGGAELAMMCDIVIASPTSKFALPETMLGLLPGAGGTQMLPRAAGKALAMDVVLTGRILSADEALAHGVVSRVSEPDQWLELACEVAGVIAGRSAIASKLAKQAVKTSFETGLSAGLISESNAFAMAFSSDDGKEGVDAFLNKREPGWTHV